MISLTNICKSYGNKLILRNINLEIRAGEFISITGDSGAGKSTLLNIIGLLETFDAGDYYLYNDRIMNAKIAKYHQYRANYLGYIFQMFYLIPGLTVKDNILLPLMYSNKKINNHKINELANQLKLIDFLHEKADYLSGGEKQRVAIARALINEPKIILCDEPTGNLDYTNTNEVMKILQNEAKKGITVVLVTHDLSIAKMADKTYMINNNGELILYE
jgi:putative ABC transport system ATP-binding protein